MKKFSILLCLLLLTSGCTMQDKEKKEQLEVAGRAYYKTYGKTYSVDEYSITLKQLRQANKDLKQSYELSKVKKCQDDTKVTLKLNNKKVEKVVIKLNCNA